jgi:hypothetical protein
MTETRKRGAERDAETRAQLTPLAPGERPLGLKLGAALALLVALANLVGVAVGVGDQPATLGLVFAAVMLAAAAGLWARNYLAVLAFQALLAVGIIYAALSLLLASSLLGLLLGVAVIAICSPIFWLLVRVMARLQVPPQ